MGVFDGLLGAGANLLGGLLGQMRSDVNAGRAQDNLNNQMAMQDEHLKHGLLYRSMDAMRAYKETGIHPLAMLGVSPGSYTPMNMVGDLGNDLGKGVAAAGQDLSRSISASSDRSSRDVMSTRFDALTTERMGLENELLRSRIASEKARLIQGTGPAVPANRWLVDGQGDAAVTGVATALKGPMTVANDPSRPFQEHGAVPGIGYTRMPDGTLMPVKGKDASERLEDDFFGNLKHFVGRTVLPMFAPRQFKAPYDAPPGKQWYVDYKGDWKLVSVPRNDPRWSGMSGRTGRR